MNPYIVDSPHGLYQPTHNITFHAGQKEVMRLDHTGMTYKGQRIEDGGEAHRAFLEVMGTMKAERVVP